MSTPSHTPRNTPTPHAPKATPLHRWTGTACLHWARILEQRIAGRQANRRHLDRRDNAMRAAHRHGIHHDHIAHQLRLSPERTRQVLREHRTD